MIVAVKLSSKEIGNGAILKLQEAFPQATVVQCDLIDRFETDQVLKSGKDLILCNMHRSYVPDLIVRKLLSREVL